MEGMVANLFDFAVRVRIETHASLTLVNATGHDVIEMRNHAATEDELAIGVAPVHAPRVACAFREDFELLRLWVVAPDAGIELDRFWRASSVSWGSICFLRCSPG